MIYEFEIPGSPVTKSRPKTDFRSKKPRIYTPKKTEAFERIVSACGLVARPSGWNLEALYRVTIEFYLPTKHKRDLDNLCKSLLDGLNKIAYLDDSQVIELHLRKGLDRDNPRSVVVIEVVDDAENWSAISEALDRVGLQLVTNKEDYD